MEMQQNNDFRTQYYDKYLSTFKEFIINEDHFYNKAGYSLYRKQYLPLIKQFSKKASILDIGCGTGIILEFLKTEGFNNISGIDLSEQQVKVALNKELNVDKISIFDFFKSNKNKFDIIFAMDLIEHFYKDELFDLFTGIYSLLNENGVLIIHTPNGDGIFPQNIIYGDITHLTIFNPNSLGQILRLTNFQNIQHYETGPTAKNFYGIIRLALWKIIRATFQSIRIIETGGTQKILTQDFISTAYKNNT